MNALQDIRHSTVEFVRTFGAMQLFFAQILKFSPGVLFTRFGLVVAQVFNTGALSIVIIMICSVFVGAVLGLHMHSGLENFNAEESSGVLLGLAIVKEIGPVFTALLFAGRAGTSLASEIGLMKATDQLSAMEMMAVNPIRRVVVPRFLGGVIAMPLLAAIFSSIALLGADLVVVQLLGVDVGYYWQQMQQAVEMGDVVEGIVKSIGFGIVGSLIAVWEGYSAVPTAEGVGRATTRTVVSTAISILILNFIITASLL